MFNDQYHSKMWSNRRLDKSLEHYRHVQIKNSEDYQTINDGILQICDENGLKRETKYLVKKSLDLYVLKFSQATAEEMLLAAYGFLFMAVKFNEDPFIEQKITFKWYFENSQKDSFHFQIEDFISFQFYIYNLGEFSLNFTTPYDYLGLYSSTFMLEKIMVQRILHVLDFSLAIPELMLASAEQLFFGVMLMIAKEKNYDRQWILRQTFSREQAEEISLIVGEYYRREIQLAQLETPQL